MMTENGWIQIITLVLGVLGPILTIAVTGWVKKILGDKITDVHHELNSRLDQYKADLAKKADAAEVAAMARGIAHGVELERQRTAASTGQIAQEVLTTAENVAKEVIATAKEEAKK